MPAIQKGFSQSSYGGLSQSYTPASASAGVEAIAARFVGVRTTAGFCWFALPELILPEGNCSEVEASSGSIV